MAFQSKSGLARIYSEKPNAISGAYSLKTQYIYDSEGRALNENQ
jgi:hypothetical protein